MSLEELRDAIPTHQPNGRKIRSDARPYAAIVLQPSAEWDGGITKWKTATELWLKQECPGKVCRMDFHVDEKTPHIHAIIQPIDDKGFLQYSKLFSRPRGQGKSEALSKIHDSYAAAMKGLGLVRGIEESGKIYEKNPTRRKEQAKKRLVREAEEEGWEKGFDDGSKSAHAGENSALEAIKKKEKELEKVRAELLKKDEEIARLKSDIEILHQMGIEQSKSKKASPRDGRDEGRGEG